MRITIEIDGKEVVSGAIPPEIFSEVRGSAVGRHKIPLVPPAELLKAAEKLGAENAGSAPLHVTSAAGTIYLASHEESGIASEGSADTPAGNARLSNR